MSKIKEKTTLQDIVQTISENNFGALSVCNQIVKKGKKIDPNSIDGSLTNILLLDSLKITGRFIWILYKNVCDMDIVKTIAVLRGIQLGLYPPNTVKQVLVSIDTNQEPQKTLDVDMILDTVKKELPNFGGDYGY